MLSIFNLKNKKILKLVQNDKRVNPFIEQIREHERRMYKDIYYKVYAFFEDIDKAFNLVSIPQDVHEMTNKWMLKRVKNKNDVYKLHRSLVRK